MLDQEKKNKLFKIYSNADNPASFSGVDALHQEANAGGIGVTRKEVANFLSTVPTYGMFKSQQHIFQRGKG